MSRWPPRDPAHDHAPEVVASRRAWTSVPMPHVAGAPVPTEAARGNIEGMIGYVQVPVGVAGPLTLKGDFQGDYLVPFATTEGAMTASYQRGMKVAAEVGGVRAHVLADALVVWPTIACDSVAAALQLGRWVDEHRPALIMAAATTTLHGTVHGLTWEVLGRHLMLRLEMSTGDAHGINMVTRAAGAVLAAIPGGGLRLPHGFDVEKRASPQRGRGKWVVAELVLPADVALRHWRCSPAQLEELWRTYTLAFGRMGTLTHAIQVANGLAAIYLATGQDVAYVTESSVCTLSLEERGGDLHATLDLPHLHAATVGGGTGKGTAAECQALVGAQSAAELACVMAGALLVGDVNLAASFLDGGFLGAHESLGRNRPA